MKQVVLTMVRSVYVKYLANTCIPASGFYAFRAWTHVTVFPSHHISSSLQFLEVFTFLLLANKYHLLPARPDTPVNTRICAARQASVDVIVHINSF